MNDFLTIYFGTLAGGMTLWALGIAAVYYEERLRQRRIADALERQIRRASGAGGHRLLGFPGGPVKPPTGAGPESPAPAVPASSQTEGYQ